MNKDIINIEFNKLRDELYTKGIDIRSSTVEDIIFDFESALDSEYKKTHGVVYTPQWVANAMVSNVIEEYIKKRMGLNIDDTIENGTLQENRDLLNVISELKLCDPCVGSGVYIFSMLGVLTELQIKLHNKIGEPYNELAVKARIISNNIYALDIDYNAVAISKFRLWAYMVNLGYECSLQEFKCNIHVGNALNPEFEGLRVDYDFSLSDVPSNVKTNYLDEWQLAWKKYINSISDMEKYRSKAELINIALEISAYIKNVDVPFEYNWKMAKNKHKDKIFIWELELPEIFNRGQYSGFDIIVGNPPYVRDADTVNIIEKYDLGKTADLYLFFYKLADKLGNKYHVSSLITPNKWFSSAYAKEFRSWIKGKLISVIDFNCHWVFENAYVPVAIATFGSNDVSNMTYANIEYIIEDNNTLEFKRYCFERQVIINKNKLKHEHKFIFGCNEIYEIWDKLSKFDNIASINADVRKGEIIGQEDRGHGDMQLIKGEDVEAFDTMSKGTIVTNKKIDTCYDDYIVLPEISRDMRAGRVRGVIPLDSILCIKDTKKGLLELLNSKIVSAIYNIYCCTNYMVGYAQVRFPRKTASIKLLPIPEGIERLDGLRNINEIDKTVQELYSLSDHDVENLKKHNI